MELRRTQEPLAKYNGGIGRLWHFTASHDGLAIELRREDEDTGVYLVLLGCTSIRAPTWWRIQALSIAQSGSGLVLVMSPSRSALSMRR